MAISITLSEYLNQHKINYEVIKHRHTTSSFDSSSSAHLPTAQIAKAVILQSKDGEYLMATLPAGHKLSISDVNEVMGKEYRLVNEWRLHELFPDCEQGAIPSVGEAYKMKMMIDDALLNAEQVYIEGGDHRYLVKIDQKQYAQMMSAVPHANICGQAIGTPKFVDSTSSKWNNYQD